MPSVLPEDVDGSSQHGPIQEEAELRGVVGEGSDEARSPQEVEAGLWSDASLPMVSQSHAAGDDELDKQYVPSHLSPYPSPLPPLHLLSSACWLLLPSAQPTTGPTTRKESSQPTRATL
jgi:hypothetical protein